MKENLPKKVLYFFKIFVLFSLSFLFLGLLILTLKINSLDRKLNEIQNIFFGALVNKSDLSSEEIKDLINQSASSSANLAKEEKLAPVVKKELTNRVTYIPLGGSFLTQATDWVDIPNAEVWLDIEKEYSPNAIVSWDVFLKVDNANGQALARIFDITHGIAVNGSEISVSDKDKFTQVSSGNLKLWSGRNLYRVQLKSLNSFSVFLDSPRLKISY